MKDKTHIIMIAHNLIERLKSAKKKNSLSSDMALEL
jgi:hypothetical protein